jgi:hypothetical protein
MPAMSCRRRGCAGRGRTARTDGASSEDRSCRRTSGTPTCRSAGWLGPEEPQMPPLWRTTPCPPWRQRRPTRKGSRRPRRTGRPRWSRPRGTPWGRGVVAAAAPRWCAVAAKRRWQPSSTLTPTEGVARARMGTTGSESAPRRMSEPWLGRPPPPGRRRCDWRRQGR